MVECYQKYALYNEYLIIVLLYNGKIETDGDALFVKFCWQPLLVNNNQRIIPNLTITISYMTALKYLSHYPENLQQQIATMLEKKTLGKFLKAKYPAATSINSDKALRAYVTDIKNQYLKKSSPLSQIKFDDKIHVINNALGLHTYVSRVQGNKLKSKNELRVAAIFKKAPEPFLNMIVVHELAHLKEKEHNKTFYRLCEHMLPNYHQLEFELRVYLTFVEQEGELYS